MSSPIDIKAVAKDKFIISSPGHYIGDVMLSAHGEFRFFPSPQANSLTESELTRITRLVRRQNRIYATLNKLNPNPTIP